MPELRRFFKDLAARSIPGWLVARRGASSRRTVALTFDDGPHPAFTPRVLNALREAGAHATFFLIGKEARKYPELVARIVREGHAVGCHTENHADLSRLDIPAAWRECQAARRHLEAITGRPVTLLRPPWGKLNAGTLLVAAASRMTLALWSLDSHDYQKLPPDELLKRVQELAPQPGDVLLFHDDGENTARALPAILAYLRRRELRGVSMEELLAR